MNASGGVGRSTLTDLLARLVTSFLFVMLSINLFNDFLRTHRITGLLLVISEAAVVVFTIVRRRAQLVDRSPLGVVVTALSVVGPPLIRSSADGGLVPDEITALVSGLGLCIVIAGKLTLGRSFGLIPANRGVVVAGPYLVVRHPIYAGYLLTHVAFLAAHPTPANAVILLVADTALIIRALREERVLGHDDRYRAYCRRVGWHLVPGVF